MDEVKSEAEQVQTAKAKKPGAKKAKAKAKAKKRHKPKVKKHATVRTERLDMRLSKAEKTRVTAKARKLRRTVTSLVIEAIEKIR